MASADRFSVLFQKAWTEFKLLFKPLLAGAAIWAALTVATQMLGSGIDQDASPTGREVSMIAGFTALSSIFSLAANVFFLAMVIEGKKTFGEAMKRVLPLALPFIGVSLWMFLRSFAWVAIVGIIVFGIGGATQQSAIVLGGWLLIGAGIVTAIVLAPRFYLAPYILIGEKKRIGESVQLSYERTRGYWGKVVGNSILLSLCMLPITILSAMIAGMFGAGAGIFSALSEAPAVAQPSMQIATTGAGFVNGVIVMMITALTLLFGKYLTATITANPKA